MSIIHEALKKVQQNFSAMPPAADPAATPSQPVDAAAPQKPVPNVWMSLLSVLLVAGAALFLYSQCLKHWPQIRQLFNLPARTLPKIALPKLSFPKAVSSPAVAKAAPNAFNVQGVVTQNGHAVALINDRIYEAGDQIGEVKIVSISASAVTVLRNGVEETVPLQR
jgi:hypothetical protein